MLGQNKPTKKTTKDLIWNYSALVVVACSGILINLLVSWYYPTSVLGAFNQIYAIYVVVSQLSVGGIHFSALRHISPVEDRKSRTIIAWSALILVLFLAITVSLLLISASKIIEQIFNSEVVAKGVILIAPGLILFSINKVLSAILNGMLYMKEFAVAQALRPLTIILCIAFCIYAKFPEYWLSVSLSFGELTTFLWLSIILFKILPIRFYIFKSQQFKNWMYQHFLFGIKGFVSGFLAEINTRVDVIMLGIFVSDEMVGVYSFASMFAEGFYMLTTVIRNNINPILSKMVIAKDFDGITKFIDKIRRWFCPTISLIILIFISLYPLFLKMVFRTEKYDLYIQSWLVIIILLLGILVASGYIPFENILIQGGNPTYQSLLTVINVTSNIIFNAIFIPLIGISGAAIGTTCAYLISTVYLCQMVQHCFGFSLFRLNFSSK